MLGCGEQVESGFRFCPWCAAPQRRKLTEFFGPHPEIEGDRGRALRVSRYIARDDTEAEASYGEDTQPSICG